MTGARHGPDRRWREGLVCGRVEARRTAAMSLFAGSHFIADRRRRRAAADHADRRRADVPELLLRRLLA
jgi:hypothetical protein